MVHYSSEQLDALFFALSDAARREILRLLVQGEKNIKQLSEHFQITLQAVIKHVKTLERANLVTRKKTGRENICKINTAPLQEARQFIDFYTEFWNHNLDNLSDYLQTASKEPS